MTRRYLGDAPSAHVVYPYDGGLMVSASPWTTSMGGLWPAPPGMGWPPTTSTARYGGWPVGGGATAAAKAASAPSLWPATATRLGSMRDATVPPRATSWSVTKRRSPGRLSMSASSRFGPATAGSSSGSSGAATTYPWVAQASSIDS